MAAIQEWYLNGKKNSEYWYLNGKYHREDGPAIQEWYLNGKKILEQWWINNKKYPREEWIDKLKEINSPHYEEQLALYDAENYNI